MSNILKALKILKIKHLICKYKINFIKQLYLIQYISNFLKYLFLFIVAQVENIGAEVLVVGSSK